MHFAEHGVFEVKVDGSNLFVDATGPFNEELATSYGLAIETCITQLEGKPWNQIIVLHNQSLFTPPAERVLISTLKDRKSRGLVKSAVVLVNCEGRSLITQQMTHVYQVSAIEYCFFDDIESAKDWLAQ